jgi:hypothetical protein
MSAFVGSRDYCSEDFNHRRPASVNELFLITDVPKVTCQCCKKTFKLDANGNPTTKVYRWYPYSPIN